MKRILLLVLAIGIALCNIACADEFCNHTFFPDDNNTYQTERVITAKKHGTRIRCFEVCSKCAEKRSVIIEEHLFDHDFRFEKDMGHQYPQNLHNYKYQCKEATCNYTKIVSVSCDGTCRYTLNRILAEIGL